MTEIVAVVAEVDAILFFLSRKSLYTALYTRQYEKEAFLYGSSITHSSNTLTVLW